MWIVISTAEEGHVRGGILNPPQPWGVGRHHPASQVPEVQKGISISKQGHTKTVPGHSLRPQNLEERRTCQLGKKTFIDQDFPVRARTQFCHGRCRKTAHCFGTDRQHHLRLLRDAPPARSLPFSRAGTACFRTRDRNLQLRIEVSLLLGLLAARPEMRNIRPSPNIWAL